MPTSHARVHLLIASTALSGASAAALTACGAATDAPPSCVFCAAETAVAPSTDTGATSTTLDAETTTTTALPTTGVDSSTTGGEESAATSSTSVSTGGSTGPAGPGCEDIAFGGPFTVSQETPNFQFELPMAPGVVFSRLEVRFTFDPADWGGQCYNPYYSPPKLVPVFHQFMTIRRGTHWCKGGNIGEFSLAGPDKNRLISEVFYRDPPWEGAGCGPEIPPFPLFGGEHTVVPVQGQPNPVELIYDAAGGALSLSVAGQVFEGVPHPDAELLALEGYPLVLNLSFSESNECYDAEGNPSDQATCCHAPSWGWTFDAVNVRLCT